MYIRYTGEFMNNILKDKKLRKKLTITGLLLVLPLIVLGALQVQNLVKRAAGSNEVGMRFTPSSGVLTPGQQITVKVAMHKLALRTINVSGAQAVIDVSSKFVIDSADCEAPFNGLPFTKINGQSVTIMCAIATTANPVPVNSSDLVFAQLNLTVLNSAGEGNAEIGFTSTRVTEAGIPGQAPDVSTAGTGATFSISSSGEITPTQPDTGDVTLSFSPSSVNLPPASNVKIMADSGGKFIAFVRAVITFDNSKVNLNSEITTNPQLSTIVEKTGRVNANQLGRANIVIAAAPTDSQPSGVFELASFSLTNISTTADSTQMSFDISDMQIVDGTGQELSIGSSVLSIIINGSNVTPSPGGEFEIPIGEKDQLVIDIGGEGPTPTGGLPTDVPGNVPQITFSAVLAHTQSNPDMYFRLRVKDELYFLDNPGVVLNPSCTTPGPGDKDFYIPMRAQGTIYKPVPSINIPVPSGVNVADVTADGWVILNGVSQNRYYSLLLKAPLFRGSEMAEHVFLKGGQKPEQVFSWINNPLEPGDLPNPNNQMLQDCTVNSIDISLIVARIGSTNTPDLSVGDVNFDNIVNGNDVSKVVNTLSTKPDDDL